ncbi:MAG TPA: SAM-dependent methyltransferase [Candidatus Methylomirabilis sp.]|nr:SAM-dependent methyltransferase [Candidatus Methylomirabilis sp.]
MPDANSSPYLANAEPLIRNVSDTARWVAVYRAQESERPDAHFRDPFARRLAGERGEQIAKSMPLGRDNSWSMVTRTCIGDDIINRQVGAGVDMVINLAAGLDSRPYRMQLPPTLKWIEVDLPEILAYKEEILRNDKPVCALERIRLDLSNAAARRDLFAELSRRCNAALINTEGLLIYLNAEDVVGLAKDLAVPSSFQSWMIDIASPGLLKMLAKRMSKQLMQTAPFKFAPPEGPDFFIPYGWKPVEVNSLLKNAARLKRLSPIMRFFALLPETPKSRRDRPWSGVCLLKKQ